MTCDTDAFYAERDARTVQYGGDVSALTIPVTVILGADVAGHRPGQVAALALANMLARVHRHLHFVVPHAPLRAASLVKATDLATAMHDTVTAITPVLAVTTSEDYDRSLQVAGVSVGIGSAAPDGLDVYLGWSGGRGEIANSPVACGGENADVLGAATAASLGALAAFRLTHGNPVRPTTINVLERTADDDAGTTTITGPIEVGNVLVLGAGAVTNALFYWLREFGVSGTWDVVDADIAELHNTNRCMAMTAADAGWPDGVPGGAAGEKAKPTPPLLDAEPHVQWYDGYVLAEAERHDLVLTLANERGVRAAVATRGEPLLLHATTSPHWTAELHRHIADRDDCPACRLPSDEQPRFGCSTGPAEPGDTTSRDAALPFLSAMAGLMLTAALTELHVGSGLIAGRHNHWRLHFEFPDRPWRSSVHPNHCLHTLDARTRRAIHTAAPRRHDDLDRPD
jgi:hypothetical protein